MRRRRATAAAAWPLLLCVMMAGMARADLVDVDSDIDDFAIYANNGTVDDASVWLTLDDDVNVVSVAPDPANNNNQLNGIKVGVGGCPPGFYCGVANDDSSISSMLACPPGTYQPAWGATSYDACMLCPNSTTRVCPIAGLAEPIDCRNATTAALAPLACAALGCPTGSYFFTSSECRVCPRGAYCVASAQHACPPGTYNTHEGLSALEQCTPCPPGSYAFGQSGRVNACPPCPMDHVCANATDGMQTCPVHTTSAEGSTSMLNCTCMAGYQCQYTKQITFNMRMDATPATLAVLQNPAVVQQVLGQIAVACHVDPSRVHYIGIAIVNSSTAGNRRRLLSPAT